MKFNLKEFLEKNIYGGSPNHIFIVFKNKSVVKYKDHTSIRDLYFDSVKHIFGSKWSRINPSELYISFNEKTFLQLKDLQSAIKNNVHVGSENIKESTNFLNDIIFDKDVDISKIVELLCGSAMQTVPDHDIELDLSNPEEFMSLVSRNKDNYDKICGSSPSFM